MIFTAPVSDGTLASLERSGFYQASSASNGSERPLRPVSGCAIDPCDCRRRSCSLPLSVVQKHPACG